MMRIAGVSVLFTTIAATGACGVGGGEDPGGESDDRNDVLGIVCEATFTVSGTFTPGTPGRPLDENGVPITGCWPVGTWTFTAAMAMNGCPTAPTVLPSYSFRVERMDDGAGLVESFVNLTTLGGLQYHMGVSSNGRGCEGNFEFGSADGQQYWHMKPLLLNPPSPGDPPATTLTGSGDFTLYDNDGWPWK